MAWRNAAHRLKGGWKTKLEQWEAEERKRRPAEWEAQQRQAAERRREVRRKLNAAPAPFDPTPRLMNRKG
jgi:hypothetical protein